jgi:hypothetical protein
MLIRPRFQGDWPIARDRARLSDEQRGNRRELHARSPGPSLPHGLEGLNPRLLTPRTIVGLQATVGNATVTSLIDGVQSRPRIQRLAPAAPPAAPAAMTAQEIQSARTAAATRFGPETIRQLQTAVFVDVDGIYNDDTVKSIYAKQKELPGPIGQKGVPNAEFFAHFGIIPTKPFVAGTLPPAAQAAALATTLAAQFPDGVPVAIYAQYDMVPAATATPAQQNMNLAATEFVRQATFFAESQGAVGLAGTTLKQNVPTPITELSQVIEKVQSIHLGLVALWKSTLPEGSAPAEAPSWTKVGTLATFCHGMHYGLNLSHTQESGYVTEGLHNIDKTIGGKEYRSNIESYVRGLKSAVSGDVRFLLFACNTAGSQNFPGQNIEKIIKHEETSDPKTQAEIEAERQTGKGSLAEDLALEAWAQLDAPSVYGHLMAEHMTRNPAMKVYGKDAGGWLNSKHIFDIIYDDSYINGQVQTLYLHATWDFQKEDLRRKLMPRMFRHWVDQIMTDPDPGMVAGKRKKALAQEVFMNPQAAKAPLQANMTDWLKANTTDITPLPAPARQPLFHLGMPTDAIPP